MFVGEIFLPKPPCINFSAGPSGCGKAAAHAGGGSEDSVQAFTSEATIWAPLSSPQTISPGNKKLHTLAMKCNLRRLFTDPRRAAVLRETIKASSRSRDQNCIWVYSACPAQHPFCFSRVGVAPRTPVAIRTGGRLVLLVFLLCKGCLWSGYRSVCRYIYPDDARLTGQDILPAPSGIVKNRDGTAMPIHGIKG